MTALTESGAARSIGSNNVDGGRVAEAPEEPNVWRLGWRLSQNSPKPFWLGLILFVIFFCMPALTGWLIGGAFDALANAETDRLLWMAGAILVAEVLRMTSIHFGALQFITSWTLMQSLLQSNMLAAQVASGGPTAGQPVGSAGEAISYFRDDPEDVADFVDSWLDVTGGLAFSIVAIAVLGAVDARATAIVAIPMVAVALATKLLDDMVKRYRRADRAATVAFTGALGDVLAAATSIKVNHARQPVLERLRVLAERRRRTAVRDRVLEDGLLAFAVGSGDVALGLMLLFSASAISSGAIDTGEIALFTAYLAYLNFLPRMIGRMLARRKQSIVSFHNMASLVADADPANTVTSRPLPVRFDEAERPVESPVERDLLDELEVDGLTVTFRSSDGAVVTAVDDVSFRLERGSFTVLAGPIGAGKSTLLRALLGLVWRGEVTGSIRWNGQLVAEPASFMAPPQAAFLPQVPQLISDSVADNVLLGLEGATAADLEAALELAAVARDIADMPDGVDTLIGPRGMRLSGGQRQRAAAARALVRRPELLVLDDLSSALDVETELELWQNLRQAGFTVLAVSNRPVAIELADQVIELAAGRRSKP